VKEKHEGNGIQRNQGGQCLAVAVVVDTKRKPEYQKNNSTHKPTSGAIDDS